MTPKQKLFTLEYLKDLNATQAAIRAGYSPKRADQIGFENLRKPEIAEAIREERRKREGLVRVDATWLLKRLADEAKADLADLFNDNGALKPVNEWPEIWRTGLVAGVDVYEEFAGSGEERAKIGQTVKIKLSDRVKRLELIGKHVDVQAFLDRSSVEIGKSTVKAILSALPEEYARKVEKAIREMV